MLQQTQDERLQHLADKIEASGTIDRALYDHYRVKRGLRYKDGTGVLVGITKVGYVTGYEKVDDKKIPREGDLMYRGYSILDLVGDALEHNRHCYEEIIYLLLFGELPSQQSLRNFKDILNQETYLPEHYLEDVILKTPSPNIMNKMMQSVLALYSRDAEPEDITTMNVLRQSVSLIAKMPLIMSYSYSAKRHYIDGCSLFIHYPDKSKSIAENILHLIRKDSTYTAEEAKILDLMLVLHAEHGGGNNSTFATHVVSSSGTDTYSAIATALGALKGPRHGGANLMADAMLANIRENVRDMENEAELSDYLRRILAGDAFDGKGLIYGLGHAVYTKSDPRALLLKEQARSLAKVKGYEEDLAFVERVERLGGAIVQEKNDTSYPACANVDLYSGLVYRMLNIPLDLYTPLFALSRMAGWCAHRLEQIQDTKIIRPAYVNLGGKKRYKAMDER
ncbi:MAG: citrate synthase [Tissierellia bacterium]|nr:citrate synthase [Tissierellia bacterium]